MPQAAQKLNNDMSVVYDNEILVDVIALNIDSASFTQIEEEAGGDVEKIGAKILEIVAARGKQQNPVTGSGGMLIGRVAKIGKALQDRDLQVGDKIATLVSLSLTPLKIDRIVAIHPAIDRVEIVGQAILFESGLYAKLPEDMDERLALAALDVAGAPAQVATLVKPGRVVANIHSERSRKVIEELHLAHAVVVADATKPVEFMRSVLAANGGQEFDVSICCVNIQGAEMASILPVRDNGVVYFFSMATSFTRAALGAEGVGKDVTMVIGNGYTKGHAEITLWELRENPGLRALFEKNYVKG